MPLSLKQALIATFASALTILFTRAFSFILFAKKDPPKIVRFVEKYIPPMVMAILLVDCLKGVKVTASPFGIPQLVGLVFTIVTYIWKRNSMVSIFGGTAIYMILMNFM